nr:reverse transcriptase domain-containing protein [Tanacetum cinerariifolium]
MSDTSSAVTYTSFYTNSEPLRYYEEESAEVGSLGVIVYGYDGLPMQPVAPPSPDYVPGPEHPTSLAYMPGPEHPLLPVYVHEPEYPKYLVPSEDEAPMEDQPLPADALPVALSPGYIADSDLEEDPEEDLEEDHTDYPANGGDGDDEPSDDDDDDDDTNDEDEEDQDDDEDEEEHLALADSSAVPIVDHVPPTGDTEALETDESTPIPRPPQTIILFSQTRLRRERKTVRLEPPMSASIEACIARHAATLTPSLHVPSPPLPLSSPLTTSLTDAGEPLGYRTVGIRIRALLPSTSRETDIPEADMPPRRGLALLIRLSVSRNDQALLRARVNTLFKDRPDARHTTTLLDKEAMYAREAWAGFEDRNVAIEAYIWILEAQNVMQTGAEMAITAMVQEPAKEGKCLLNEKLKGKRYRFVDLQPTKFQELALMCDRMFPKESDKVERYVSGLPDMIHGNVKALNPQSMQEAIEFATKMMDKKMLTVAKLLAENKRKFKDTLRNNQNQQQPFKRNNVARAYTAGPEDKNPYGGTKPLYTKCNYHHNRPCAQKCTNYKKIGHSARDCKGRPATTNNNNKKRAQGENSRGITCFECGVQEMGSFDVIIGMDWLSKYHAVIICDEKLVRVPFDNEILIFHGDESNNGYESRFNIISCTKTQKYLLKGCPIFLAHVTTKEAKDKSKEKVHNMFHVSNMKKCLSDEPFAILLDEIHIDDKLRFVEEPVEIMDREVKRLKQSHIPIIKVRWNSRRGPQFT